MKTWGRDSRRSGTTVCGSMWWPRRCVRRTEPLPKMYALQYTQHGPRKMHQQGPPQSACPAHAGIWSWSGKKTSFFGKWRWLEHRRMDRAIHWFLYNKFNVDLVDTLWAFKAAACLVCPATAPLLNPTHASARSLAATAADIPLFFMRTSSWMACARSCQPIAYRPCSCGECFIQSWQHGRSGCQESRVG